MSKKVLEKLGRLGLKGAVSETLFVAAKTFAVGPNNSAFFAPKTLQRELGQATRELASTRKRLAKVEALLNRERGLTARLRSEAKEIKERHRWTKEGAMCFFSVSDLGSSVCLACGQDDISVAPYPYPQSADFAKLVTLWCRSCGFGWVPQLPFSLEHYYQNEYAESNRRDRHLLPEEYFGELQKPIAEMDPRYARYVVRARQQIEYIEKRVTFPYTLLDFGSGPGYALYFSKAVECHAIEMDEASVKYLDHIGAKRILVSELMPDQYDVILASHSLEHLEADELYRSLNNLRTALRPTGLLYCEVPCGALLDHHNPKKHEPHTLFFAQDALRAVFTNAGFDIVDCFYRTTSDARAITSQLRPKAGPQQHDADGLTIVVRKGPEPLAMQVVLPDMLVATPQT